MRHSHIILCLFLLLAVLGNAPIFGQNDGGYIYGKILGNEQPLPFANVYIKNTTNGTTANINGDYRLELPAGNHTIVFQHLGFRKGEKNVDITAGKSLQLNVQLQRDEYVLHEVTVTASDEDPAYEIMRKASERRKFHLQQIENYSCRAYVKGNNKIVDAPRSFLGYDLNLPGLDSTRSGIIYLSETVSELDYRQPDDFKERIISSKVSGDDKGISFNRAGEMNITFYDRLIDLTPITARSYVSPLAGNARQYYRFRLIGEYAEDGVSVNKIKVMPRRSQDPAFSGFIYIQDDTWRIHATNLKVLKNPLTEFIDSLNIRQTYAPYNADVWVLLSQTFDFKAQVLMFKFGGTYLGVYSNYTVNKTFEKKHFNNEAVIIEPNANERDSLYWKAVRPIPLISEERVDYKQKDSIQILRKTPAYMDSLDRVDNRFNVLKPLLTGYTLRNRQKKHRFYFSPLIENLAYNTVEGARLYFKINYLKELKHKREFIAHTYWRYGFSNKHFNAHTHLSYESNPKKLEKLHFSFGSEVKQWDESLPITEFLNSFYSLFLRLNYLKIYENRFAKIGYERELANGLKAKLWTAFEDRMPLENTTDYSLRDVDRVFTSNMPTEVFERHQAVLLGVDLELRFKQRYETHPHRKLVYPSDMPKLDISYRRAFRKLLGGDANYDFLQARLYDDVKFGLLGKGSYELTVGGYPNNKTVPFVDRVFYNGHLSVRDVRMLRIRQLPAQYVFHADRFFFKTRYEHHFNGFVFNKIPGIRKLKWRLLGGVNAFYSNKDMHYTDVFVGIENIFKVIRVDYLQGITGDVDWTIRIGFDLF